MHEARRWPRTLGFGLALIGLCEILLFIDVSRRGGLVVPDVSRAELPAPVGTLGVVARYVAINMTALCWIGYLLVFDGLLTRLAWLRGDRSLTPLRARPNRFLVAWLTSIPVWCFFDWVNFYYMDAWTYHGLPEQRWSRFVGYFIAFAAISPGMFLAAQLFQHLGFARLRTAGVRIGRPIQVIVFLLGLVFAVYPFFVTEPIANLTLWVSLIFLLDPAVYWLNGPSIIGDWRAGRWGRTLALMAGGAVCGLCWEFWNYWALAKWTYHLPFLGSLESYRYFEMPLIGFQGFLPFAIECWVMLNLTLLVLEKLGLRLAEPLPDDLAVL
jgi:hypothetical protein